MKIQDINLKNAVGKRISGEGTIDFKWVSMVKILGKLLLYTVQGYKRTL